MWIFLSASEKRFLAKIPLCEIKAKNSGIFIKTSFRKDKKIIGIKNDNIMIMNEIKRDSFETKLNESTFNEVSINIFQNFRFNV